MFSQLSRSTLEDRWQNLHFTLMFKIIKQLVAVPPTSLVPTDSRTRANHLYNKFRTIRTSTELYFVKDVNKIEWVNRRATKFVSGDHSPSSSITAMFSQLSRSTLEDRWQNLHFKIIKQLVAVPPTSLVPTDSRTRANHLYNKFRTIRTSTELYKNPSHER